MFAIKRRRTEVAVGQCWRTLSAAPSYWEVIRIYNDGEGISHVALRQVDDPTSHKTVATELLLTGLGYMLVQDAILEVPEA
ncbi:MAG TPA: hypothetical protein VFO09_05315 [Methyloceanibacter sp.]|nr:hypothetical protein [Methyloceanibacter sp.]